ncbi:serine hydrolase domain-containing protein, partial [Natronococcus sp. A-GB7]|uniref:serine hydrolase domain-containing protein n=1 Tax=Natronococcus sp. A-GB7 TaxID=3037649 RepID=UPI00241CA943
MATTAGCLPATASSEGTVIEDPSDLESFVDDAIETALDEHNIVGASVAVVQGGGPTLAKGYGEIGDEASATADDAAFQIGSVSKPVVATALMRLIESGSIDPNADIGHYLESVSNPGSDSHNITVADLVTHTAGFEERFQGTWVDDTDDLRSLEDVLEKERPEQVREPGTITSYSNYGTALAGQVIADVYGTSFEHAVADLVFEPLEMDQSTFKQPASDLDATVSTGYSAAVGEPEPQPELLLELAPAGAMTTTAADMAQFLRAHLGDTDEQGPLLASDIIERMHETWFTHHEALDGTAFGFLEETRGDERLLWHNGAIPGSFYSYLLIAPEQNIGLFVSYNTDTGSVAANEFVDSFVEKYISSVTSDTLEPSGQPERADELAGAYRGVRVDQTSYAKFSSTLQAGSIDVQVENDGTLITERGGGKTHWVEIEPLVFQEATGERMLAFGEADDEIEFLYIGFSAFEQISWYDSGVLQAGLAVVTTLGLLSGIIGWPIARTWRCYQGERDFKPPWSRPPRSARWVAGGSAICLLGFVFGLGLLLIAYPYTLLSNPPLTFRVLLLLPVLAVAGTLASGGYVLLAWRDQYWNQLSRIHYTLVVASAVGFCWLL